MKKKIRFMVLSLVLGLSTMMSGCGKEEKKVISIARSNVYVAATMQIMQEKQLIEKYLPEDVSVEWSIISTGPDLREAIVSGQADIASFSLMTFIAGYENNLPLTLVSFGGSTPINIYSCSDLKGSIDEFEVGDKVAITNRATNLHIAYLAQCKKELGNAIIKEEMLSPIPASEAVAAIESGNDYAGAVFSFPMYIKAENTGKVSLIADMTDVIQEYSIGDAIVANSDFYQKYPEYVEAFLHAQEDAIEFIVSNKSEAAMILSNIYGVEAAEIEKVIETMPPSSKVTGYDKQAELMYEAGILTAPPHSFSEHSNYDAIIK